MSPTGDRPVPMSVGGSWIRARSVLVAVAVGALGLAVVSGDTAPESPRIERADLLAVQAPADRPALFIGPVLRATDDLPADAAPPAHSLAPAATGSPAPSGPTADSATVATGSLGIPAVILDAYQRAAQGARRTCRLSWTLLASIGRIESGHAGGGRVDAAGATRGQIIGPRLDGSPGIAAIRDTDGGALDGDPVLDRAVGPMQFIPSTWRLYRADGNGDGVADPHNVHDAAAAAATYLCAGGADLSSPAELVAAIFRYNRSDAYVHIVIAWARAYAAGVRPTDSLPGTIPPPTDQLATAPAPPPPAEVLAFLPPEAVPPVEQALVPGPLVEPTTEPAIIPPATTPTASTPATGTPPTCPLPTSTPPTSTPPTSTPATGTASDATTPVTIAPSGAAPSGAAPSGTDPSSAAPSGAAQSGTALPSTAPSASTQATTTGPSGAALASCP